MKQFPKLTLVGREEEENAGTGATRVSGAFELVALDALDGDERLRVQEGVQEILPKAAILGIARTPRLWDLRPVVACAGEESPSIVRFVGPEIFSNQHLSTRIKETYDRLKERVELNSGVLSCGVLRGEFWYRRPLAESTLAHVLSSAQSLSEYQVFSIAHRIVEELTRWHEKGLLHCHLTSSNIWVAPQGKVFLFDPSIGLSSVQAAKGRTDYNLQSFAPELLHGESPSVRSDVFGLGLVLRRMFLGLAKRMPYENDRDKVEKQVRPFLELSESMLQADPQSRPSLAQIRRFVTDAHQGFEEQAQNSLAKKKPDPGHKQGKIVRPAKHETAPIIEEAPVEVIAPVKEEKAPEQPAAAKQPAEVQPPPQVQPPYVQPAAPVYSYPPAGYAPPGSIPVQPAPAYYVPAGSPVQAVPYSYPPPAYPAYQAPQTVFSGIPQQPGQLFHQAVPQTVPAGPPVPVQTKKDSDLLGLVLILLLLLGGFWFYRTQYLPVASNDDPALEDVSDIGSLKEAWQSKIPSRMITVAEKALGQNETAKLAQGVVVESMVRGDEGLIGVNVPLLRVAFDGAWESELSVQDRRSAMAMGLAGLLKDRLPKDLQRIDGLHPGVILAATASAGKTASHILSGVPASVLTRLVPPYGPAFKELVKESSNLNCADDAVQRLARLGTRGAIDGLDDITLFLKTEAGAVREDADLRLRALAAMFSYSNSLANSLLQVLLKHPNLSIDIPSIKWAKDWSLADWKELEAGDQLFVLAGVPPAGTITADHLGTMFGHPGDAIRAFAIAKALDRIPFEHPGAYDVFRAVQNDPQLLNPRQTIELAYFLQHPGLVQMARIQSWLGTKPPVQVVAPLLLATSGLEKSTSLDTALAIYLKESKWKPEIGVLRKLSQHPDSYSRLFAYNELYLMDDRETSKEFLAAAIKRESNRDNKTQLQQMLTDLSTN